MGMFSALILLAVPAAAQNSRELFSQMPAAPPADVVKVRTAWSVDQARPGDRVLLAVIADIQKGFHINADSGQLRVGGDFNPVPTRVRVVSTAGGVTVTSAHFPPAHPVKVAYAKDPLMLFDGQVIIYLTVELDRQIAPGVHPLEIEFSYQACDDKTCLFPQKVTLAEQIRVVGAGGVATPMNEAVFSVFEDVPPPAVAAPVSFDLFGWRFSLNASSALGLVLLLATAAFGGMLLNFTPCVLPLVPIKIISLSNAADKDRKRCFMLGLFMFLGVLAFWLALGSMIATISGFTATNQLFQYPPFTIIIGVIIAVMAMGMCGVFHTRLPNFLYVINPDRESLPGSFGLGILTAVLSTPCTAPFMGAAAAWAVTQPPTTTLFTFAAIGTGMAFPYLVLSAFPDMVRKIPRTGPGSVLLKEIMGLLMMAAAAYFIGSGLSAVFSHAPYPPGRLYWWVVMAFCAAGGGWLIFKILRITSRTAMRVAFTFVGLLMISGSLFGGIRLTHRGPIDWIYYTPQRFEAAVSEGKTVVMVFTAEWCLNCKVLEQGVLHSRRITDLFSDRQIVPIKTDITGNNPTGKAKLREVGSLAIPLLVVFSPDGKVVFKSDFYTVDQVVKAVVDARNGQGKST